MNLMEAVPVLIPRILAASMADCGMGIAPLRQARIECVLIGVDLAARGDERLDQRLDALADHPPATLAVRGSVKPSSLAREALIRGLEALERGGSSGGLIRPPDRTGPPVPSPAGGGSGPPTD